MLQPSKNVLVDCVRVSVPIGDCRRGPDGRRWCTTLPPSPPLPLAPPPCSTRGRSFPPCPRCPPPPPPWIWGPCLAPCRSTTATSPPRILPSLTVNTCSSTTIIISTSTDRSSNTILTNSIILTNISSILTRQRRVSNPRGCRTCCPASPSLLHPRTRTTDTPLLTLLITITTATATAPRPMRRCTSHPSSPPPRPGGESGGPPPPRPC